MTRRIVVAALLAVAAVAGPAAAQAWQATGTIAIGNPSTANVGGVTEMLAPCDDASDLQGVDGFWVRLPDGAEGSRLTLSSSAPDADADAYFYTASCQYIDNITMAQASLGGTERGLVPQRAAWVIVNLYLGVDAGFRLAME